MILKVEIKEKGTLFLHKFCGNIAKKKKVHVTMISYCLQLLLFMILHENKPYSDILHVHVQNDALKCAITKIVWSYINFHPREDENWPNYNSYHFLLTLRVSKYESFLIFKWCRLLSVFQGRGYGGGGLKCQKHWI